MLETKEERQRRLQEEEEDDGDLSDAVLSAGGAPHWPAPLSALVWAGQEDPFDRLALPPRLMV